MRKGADIVQKNINAIDLALNATRKSRLARPRAKSTCFLQCPRLRRLRARNARRTDRQRGERLPSQRFLSTDLPHRTSSTRSAISPKRSRLGAYGLYPVRQLHHGLSSRSHPHEATIRPARKAPATFRAPTARARSSRPQGHGADRPRRLHGLRRMHQIARRSTRQPRQKGHQLRAADRASRDRKRELGLLPLSSEPTTRCSTSPFRRASR